jgi:hypothetical protein
VGVSYQQALSNYTKAPTADGGLEATSAKPTTPRVAEAES